MDYETFFDAILSIDPKIRYVGIYHKGEMHDKMRKGLQSLLTPEETKTSIVQAIVRNATRQVLSIKIGNPIYSTTRYEKVIRSTIPINENDLVMVSMETDSNHQKIVEQVIKIKDKFIPELESR